jgi:hypothetical protein
MSKIKITINVETDFPLSDEEINLVMADLKARMQGYYTKPPECLKSSKMSIEYDKKYNASVA